MLLFHDRQFLATSGVLVAGTWVPDWAEAFQQTGAGTDAVRAEVAEAALARAAALGASYADIRINRYRRESIATRERQVQNVSRSTSYGLGLRVLVNGAWGFAATNNVEPGAARAAAEQAVAIARANAALATRKVVLADADKVVTTWTNAFKRDPFEVPLDTKIGFLMKLNETAIGVAGVSFVNSQVLFVDEQKYFASSEGSRITAAAGAHLSAVQHHRRRPRERRFPDTRPSSIAPNCWATSTSRSIRGCRTPRRPATKWSRS